MTGDTVDRDDLEAGGEQPPQNRTERVRIIGARRAGGEDVSPATPAEEPAAHNEGFGPEDWQEPLAEAELPHWTEAPTGEIPAVLGGDVAADGTEDPWTSMPEPSWREKEGDWERAPAFDPGLLAEAQDRPITGGGLAERQPWEFDLHRSGDNEWDEVEPAAAPGADPMGPAAWLGGHHGDETTDEPTTLLRPSLDVPDVAAWGAANPTGEVPLEPADDGGDLLGAAAEPAEPQEFDDPVLASDLAARGRPSWMGGRLARRGGRAPRHAPDLTRDALGDAQVGARTPVADLDAEPVGSGTSGLTRGAGGRLNVSSRNLVHSRAPAAGSAADRRRTGGGGHDPVSRRTGRNMPVALASGAVIGAAALIAFHFGTVPAVVVVSVIVTLGAMEAYAAFRGGGYHPATLLGLVATVSLMVATYTKGQRALPIVLVLLVALTFVWHLIGVDRRADPVRSTGATVLVFCWVAVFGSYGALLLAPAQFPDRHGIAFLLGAAIAAVAYDVGALAAGALIGRHPLSAVSPNKTWEGLAGGTVFALVFSVAIVHFIHPWDLSRAAALGLVVSVVSPLGDLGESLVKRTLGLKDMGRILPGHGGLLDRVDGLLFVLPATFYLVKAFHVG